MRADRQTGMGPRFAASGDRTPKATFEYGEEEGGGQGNSVTTPPPWVFQRQANTETDIRMPARPCEGAKADKRTYFMSRSRKIVAQHRPRTSARHEHTLFRISETLCRTHERDGDPGRIRTSDPLLRMQPLYPAELRSRTAGLYRMAGRAGEARNLPHAPTSQRASLPYACGINIKGDAPWPMKRC